MENKNKYFFVLFTMCRRDESSIYSIEAILKHKQVAYMLEEKCCLLFSNLFVPEIFKFLKLAKWWCHTVNQIWSNMMKKRYLSNSPKVLLPWQHTGFQASPILKAFLTTFVVPFSYLQMHGVQCHMSWPLACVHEAYSVLKFKQRSNYQQRKKWNFTLAWFICLSQASITKDTQRPKVLA